MSIPDHIRYGSPEECHDALSRPMRCQGDPRWWWPIMPEPLPPEEQARLDAALSARWQDWRGKAVTHAGL